MTRDSATSCALPHRGPMRSSKMRSTSGWVNSAVWADFLARNPNLYIPQMEVLTAEDWLVATKVQEVDTDAALGTLRGKGRRKFSRQLGEAIKQAIASTGQIATDPAKLGPYPKNAFLSSRNSGAE